MRNLTDAISERYIDINEFKAFRLLSVSPKEHKIVNVTNVISDSDITILIPANSSPRVKGFY